MFHFNAQFILCFLFTFDVTYNRFCFLVLLIEEICAKYIELALQTFDFNLKTRPSTEMQYKLFLQYRKNEMKPCPAYFSTDGMLGYDGVRMW